MLSDLPAELLALVLSFCSALDFVRCTTVSQAVAKVARQQAAQLVEQLWSLGTTWAARADGAASIHILGHVAGLQRPVVPGRFALATINHLCGHLKEAGAAQPPRHSACARPTLIPRKQMSI